MVRISITEARMLGLAKGKSIKIHYADQKRAEKKLNTAKKAWQNVSELKKSQ